MSLSKESADAFRQCIRIIAPHYAPAMRRVIVGNVESFINEGKWIPAWELKDITRLFYPSDQQRQTNMESQMLTAMKSNELQSTPRNHTFLSGDLAAWLDCPPVPKDSPLRFWLPEWMQKNELPAGKPVPTPEKGDEDEQKESEETYTRGDGEPRLKAGNNARANVEAWVEWQATNKVRPDDTLGDLATRIKLIAERWKYQSTRAPFSKNSITRMLPAGITGGRAKNTGKPKK